MQDISAQFLITSDSVPSPSTSHQLFMFSPVLAFAPHDLHFSVAVRVRFPYSALQGWILKLMRQEPGRNWMPVLTLDTDNRQVIHRNEHCNYDVDSSLLELTHFCKYRWCGYRKENVSRSEKMLACLLFARIDPSENSCNCILHLSDNCEDVLEVSFAPSFPPLPTYLSLSLSLHNFLLFSP